MRTQRIFVIAALGCAAAAGCSKNPAEAPAADQASEPAANAAEATPAAKPAEAPASVIAIDGSSTVFPITEAVAEEFQKNNPAKVTIGVSGTGGGFKKLCAGEVAIAGASRPIKPTEIASCGAKQIEFVELPVAYDGLAVAVNPNNEWAKSLTVEELKRLWEPEAQGKVTKWSQIRTGFPDKEVHLFGPGVDSGTYDYFTAAIVGKEHASRGDFTASEDDNVLVQGVSRDPNALGFFGLAYYEENHEALKLVPIDDAKDDNGKGPIAPSVETVANGTYQPLSRPIFIYVSKSALARPEVSAFVEFYLKNGEKLVKEARYVPLPARAYELALKRAQTGKTGSLFAGGSQVGVTVESLLARE